MELYYSDSPAVNFDAMREMAPYLQQPQAMYVGCPGKHGYLKLAFELDAQGKSILRDLDRRAPLIVQQELYFDENLPGLPCVYILSSGGPNVDGDRYVQRFSVGRDAMAHISTGAATKLAEMKYNYSGMTQEIALDSGAYLEYMPEPVIPCRHTRYICDTAITCHPSATLFYSEVYMPGRKYYHKGGGEVFQYDVLSVCSHAQRPDGRQLFREKFVIDPQKQELRNIGCMHHYDVFANILILTPVDKAEEIYAQIDPYIAAEHSIALGITHLPNQAGLLVKVLGMEPGPVKAQVRQVCSLTRQAVKGVPVPPEFPWR